LTEEEKKPQKRERAYTGGALLIAVTIFISILFTGVIAYGVQSLIGGGEAEEGVLVDGVREFGISAQQWYYEPAIIKVNPGDTVRFMVTSQDIMHGFAINEVGINLPLSPGVAVSHEVVIPPNLTEGTYTMYCSIFCGIGHPYMKGTIVIGERGFEIGRFLPYIATAAMAGMFAAFIIVGRRRTR
jgi:cytochrome c oxidase subunit 2